eukprot:1160453-Pelagomonas_calceolata.AAC.2
MTRSRRQRWQAASSTGKLDYPDVCVREKCLSTAEIAPTPCMPKDLKQIMACIVCIRRAGLLMVLTFGVGGDRRKTTTELSLEDLAKKAAPKTGESAAQA